MNSYEEKLKDPRWQKRRLEVLDKTGWRCELCQDKTETLHVHHLIYRAKVEPWEYPDTALITLCETCHTMVHAEDLPGRFVALLRDRFKQGQLYALQCFYKLEEGSEERTKWLDSLITEKALSA